MWELMLVLTLLTLQKMSRWGPCSCGFSGAVAWEEGLTAPAPTTITLSAVYLTTDIYSKYYIRQARRDTKQVQE